MPENFEQAPSSEHQQTAEVLDQVWFDRLVGILSTDDTKDSFIPDKDQLASEKELFVSGGKNAPELKYPNLDEKKLEHRESQLLELKKEILEKETNETIKQLYRWRLNEELARARMYKAALAGDGRAFDRYNRFIYGEPSAEIFNDSLLAIRESVAEDLSSDNPDLKSATQALLELLPGSTAEAPLKHPDEETFHAVKQFVQDDLEGYQIEFEDTKGKLNAEQIVASFVSSLDKIHAKGWSVILDTSARRLITITQEKKEMYIPKTREVFPSKLKSLTVHEILTHALRGVKGEQSSLKLTAIGLDRSEGADEGAATARTQAYQGESFEGYASMLDHLSIGLATGLDGSPRNFREVYNILYAYHYYKNTKKGLDPKVAKEKAETSAWNTTRMNFRGTDGGTRGACNREKIIYREGNIQLWMQLDQNPGIMEKYVISLGKIDTNNTRHIYALYQLNMITKEQLDEIEKTLELTS